MKMHWQQTIKKKVAWRNIGWLALIAGLAGCSPTEDMQGVDPREYYSQHPIENQVETHSVSQQLHFENGVQRLDGGEIARLKNGLRNVSAMAADGVRVQMTPADYKNAGRRQHLTAVLRSMGYAKEKIDFEPSSALSAGDVQVDVQYASIIPPNCPDWRRSPVTTYSNTRQGNFSCATVVNLGVMVADPHDLVRGPSSVTPDTQRTARVVDQYRSGQSFAQPASASMSGSSGGGGSSSSDSGDSGPPPAQ